MTHSTDSPWTEVMSVKGLAASMPKVDTASSVQGYMGTAGGERNDDETSRQVPPTHPILPPEVPSTIQPPCAAGARAESTTAGSMRSAGTLTLQPMGGGALRSGMTYASAVTRTLPPFSPTPPTQVLPTRVGRRDDTGRAWEGGGGVVKEGGEDPTSGVPGKVNVVSSATAGGGSSGAGAVGIAQSRDPVAATATEGKRLRIIDARSIMNAKGNALMGKGHEIIARLGGEMCTTLAFAGIENIHVMRESYGALRQICCELTRNTNWLQMLHETKWLLHLSTLIRGSLVVALHLERGDPVLVHCSDGWDRTSQMVALAQLLLDPFYRTIAGELCVYGPCCTVIGSKGGGVVGGVFG